MSDFSSILENWYVRNGRFDLPWRKVSDPYLIWLSETILQQTRVAQGYDYYLRFAERFPNVFELAAADEDEVLKLWQGLGYYSRARNLHFAAKTIAELGAFPTDYEGVRKLKGIGDYTAAAICSFAYNQPHAVVDGNVYRVLSRFFGIHTPIDTNDGKKEFTSLANELLDKEHPGKYNSAIMDFGALQCTPKSPNCDSCPFAGSCYALQTGTINDLPVKSKKTAVANRYIVYVYIENAQQLILRRRGKGDIWQGLYEPYLLEFSTPPSDAEVMDKIKGIPGCQKATIIPVAKGLKHVLTHRRLWIDCYQIKVSELPQLEGYLFIDKDKRENYATPRIVTTIFSMIDKMENNEEKGLFDDIIPNGKE